MFDDADSKLSSNDHFQKAVAVRKGRLIAPQLEHLVEFLQNPFYSILFNLPGSTVTPEELNTHSALSG